MGLNLTAYEPEVKKDSASNNSTVILGRNNFGKDNLMVRFCTRITRKRSLKTAKRNLGSAYARMGIN